MDTSLTATELRAVLADALKGAAERLRAARPQQCEEPAAAAPPTADIAIGDQRRVTMSITEAAEVLGVSRTTAYEAVRSGQLPVIRLGRRNLVPVEGLRRWIAEQSAPRQP